MSVSLPTKIIGTLKLAPSPNRFVYLKIQDEVVYKLFNEFKEKGGKKDVELPPYFDSSRFVNPIGAHVTLINSYHFHQMEHKAEFIELYVQNTPPLELSCVASEEIIPQFWKEMEVVWVCSVKSLQIDLFFHAVDFKPTFNPHFTFAVKPIRLKMPALAIAVEEVTKPKKVDSNIAWSRPLSLKEGKPSKTLIDIRTYEITDVIDSHPSEARALKMIQDIGPGYLRPEHLKKALNRGFYQVAVYILEHKNAPFKPAFDKKSIIEEIMHSSGSDSELLVKFRLTTCDDFLLIHIKMANDLGFKRAANFIRGIIAERLMDPIYRIVYSADSEEEAIEALTQFKYFMINANHIILARRQGFNRIADFFQKRVCSP